MPDESTSPASWFERTTADAEALGLRFTQYRSRTGVTFEIYIQRPASPASPLPNVTTLFTASRRARVDAFLLGFRLGSGRTETCPNCSGGGIATFVGRRENPCRLCGGLGHVPVLQEVAP